MGDQLMKRVVRDWGDLPGNAYKCLMVMAMSAMDPKEQARHDGERPKYWGGWQRLAIAGLGRRDWPPDRDESDEAQRVRETHRKRVVVAVRDLITMGAIESAQPGKQTLRAEYWLTLDRAEMDGKRPTERTESVQETDGNRLQNGRKPSHQIPTTPHNSQPGKPISPVGVRHQDVRVPVDKARLTPAERQAAQARADREAVA